VSLFKNISFEPIYPSPPRGGGGLDLAWILGPTTLLVGLVVGPTLCNGLKEASREAIFSRENIFVVPSVGYICRSNEGKHYLDLVKAKDMVETLDVYLESKE